MPHRIHFHIARKTAGATVSRAFAALITLTVLALSPLPEFSALRAQDADNQKKTAENPPRYREALKLYHEGAYEKSLEVVRAAVTPTHKPYPLRMLAAANYAGLKNWARAQEHLQWAVREHPRKLEPALALTRVYRRRGQLGAAAREATRSLARLGENASLRLELARAYYLMKRYRLARRHADIALSRDKNDPRIIFLDGLIFLRQGSLDNAAFRFRHALDLKPTDAGLLADLYNNLGTVLELQGDAARSGKGESSAGRATAYYKQARGMYTFALATRKDHARARANLKRVDQKKK